MTPKKTPAVSVKNASLANRSDYSAVLDEIIGKGMCPFCAENLFKHHRNPLLFQTEHWLVTENAWPYAGSTHHLLLISLAHVENGNELSPEAWADLGAAFKRLCTERNLPGATLFMRSGDMSYTGATVNHLHAQVVVGEKNAEDTEILTAVIGFKKSREP